MPDYIEELNEGQRNAVLYNDGPSLVIAGAGSGKTRVLTYKIAYLLENAGADSPSGRAGEGAPSVDGNLSLHVPAHSACRGRAYRLHFAVYHLRYGRQ